MHTAPTWFSNTSPSLIQKLQNSALRKATSCDKMTSIDYLYEETKMLPVQDHVSLISSQYLARVLQPNNPSHSVVTSPSSSRNMKQLLQSRFLHYVAPHLSNVILPPPIMGQPSSPYILDTYILLPFPSLFYLITASFRLLPRKWFLKKLTFLGPTEVPFHNFDLLSVAPSIPIVRG